jgi:hypothetical protein
MNTFLVVCEKGIDNKFKKENNRFFVFGTTTELFSYCDSKYTVSILL